MKPTPGTTALINFSLTFSDGTHVDSNEGQPPIPIEIGHSYVLPMVEEALLEMQVGDRKRIEVPPEEGYGYASEDDIIEMPIDSIPKDARYVGASMEAEDDSGERRIVIITKVTPTTATVDFNHPYAGRTLVYDIELVAVESN